MAGEKVRLASVGLGWWGGMLADAVKRSGAGEVAAGFARSEDARQAFAEKHGCRPAASLDEVLKDPEIEGVLIATPHSTHLDLIGQAASAGKHVFVEKPLTLTVAEGKRAYAATQKAGVTLLVGHNRRRAGGNRRIKQMIDKGELGQLHMIESNLSLTAGQNPRPGWRSDPAECPVGGLTGLGVHMIDNLLYLAGPVKRVSALSKKILGKSDIDDVSNVILEHESGPLGYIGIGYVLPKICVTSAYGTEASVWTEEEGARLFIEKKDEQIRKEIPCEAGDMLAEQMAEFCGCIRGTAQPETGGPSSIEVVAVMQAIVESVKTGKVTDVAPFR